MFDVIINELLKTLKIDDDEKKLPKNKYFKDKFKQSEGLDNDSRLSFLSQYWSAFDYDLINILLENYPPKDRKLKDKMKKYKEMFNACSIQSFFSFFRGMTVEMDEFAEIEVKVRVKISEKMSNLRDVKEKVYTCLQDNLKTDNLRLLKLQDHGMFVFGATFSDPMLPLNNVRKKMLKAFRESGITEIKLKRLCLYGLDGKI